MKRGTVITPAEISRGAVADDGCDERDMIGDGTSRDAVIARAAVAAAVVIVLLCLSAGFGLTDLSAGNNQNGVTNAQGSGLVG